MKTIPWKAVLPLLLGIIIALLPAPQGLNLTAWYFIAIFSAVILGLILEPLPAAAVGFIGVFLVAVLGLAGPKPADNIRWALSGFSNTTVWLIFGAFMFAMGYDKTGLGRRIALILVKKLGRMTLGLGYAITFSDLILAPFTPSNTARTSSARSLLRLRVLKPKYWLLLRRRINVFSWWDMFFCLIQGLSS